jgi:hypothetical protein
MQFQLSMFPAGTTLITECSGVYEKRSLDNFKFRFLYRIFLKPPGNCFPINKGRRPLQLLITVKNKIIKMELRNVSFIRQIRPVGQTKKGQKLLIVLKKNIE